MKPNLGSKERTIRIILGLILLASWFVLPGGLRWVSLLGLIPLLTGLIRFCPLWAIFRVNTNK